MAGRGQVIYERGGVQWLGRGGARGPQLEVERYIDTPVICDVS